MAKCYTCGKELPRKTSRCCGPRGSACYNRYISLAKTGFEEWPVTFWKRVDKTHGGCWLWSGATRGHMRYGVAWDPVAKKGRAAHRLAWELTYGPIPDGTQVQHTCDVPTCVNPNHLHLGDNNLNMADGRARGRWPIQRGASNTNAKLTPEQVEDVRYRYATSRVTQQALADEFGVTQGAISHAINWRTWRAGDY